MNECKSNKDYDFKVQLEEAEKAENKLKRILLSDQGVTFELKTERHLWHDTGNIVVEYESHGQPSGIAATKADYWVHELRSRDNQTLVYLMFPTPILRKLCNDLMEEHIYCRRGGEQNQMEMLLLSLENLLTRLRHFSGVGDKTFVIQRRKEGKTTKPE